LRTDTAALLYQIKPFSTLVSQSGTLSVVFNNLIYVRTNNTPITLTLPLYLYDDSNNSFELYIDSLYGSTTALTLQAVNNEVFKGPGGNNTSTLVLYRTNSAYYEFKALLGGWYCNPLLTFSNYTWYVLT
jgi:hypothetical protein